MRYKYDNKEIWGIPGGGVAEGETLSDALKRELQEELGVDISIEDLLLVAETPSFGKVKHTLHLIFSGHITGGEPKINPQHTTALEAKWIDLNSIDELILYPPVSKILKIPAESLKAKYVGTINREWF